MKVLGLGLAAALLLAAAPVMAADLIVDIPDEEAVALSSQWDGAYAGIGGIAYAAGSTGVGFQGILGANATVADNFILGGEIYAGPSLDSVNGFYFVGGAEVRGGFLVTEDVLIYGALGFEADTSTDVYGTIGGGVEFAVAEDLTLDVEYKYFDGLNTATTAHQIGLSLNWHF
jgi:outer membrane immunogenic protein